MNHNSLQLAKGKTEDRRQKPEYTHLAFGFILTPDF